MSKERGGGKTEGASLEEEGEEEVRLEYIIYSILVSDLPSGGQFFPTQSRKGSDLFPCETIFVLFSRWPTGRCPSCNDTRTCT